MLKSTLRPFQRDGVERLKQWNGRGLLADEQGLGKTIQALTYVDETPDSLPTIVLCPAHLKEGWSRQAKQHIGMDSAVLYGTKVDWGQIEGQKLVILNPTILWDWLWQLVALKPKLVILDECQNYSNPDSQRTYGVRELLKGVPKLLALSGTPIENRPVELWPVLNMIDPETWPSRHAYGHRYCGAKRNRFSGGWDFKGCTRAKELHEILTAPIGGYMIRRLKRDVLKDLPEKMHNVVPLRLPKRAMKEYKLARDDIRSWMRAHYTQGGGRNQAEALQRMNVLRQLTAQLKLPLVLDWIETFLESGEKLIVFGTHKATFVKKVYERFQKQAVVVHGDVTPRARQEAFDRFNDCKDCRLFIGNWIAAGTGWSSYSCSNVAAGEPPWQPAVFSQGVDRVDGIGRGQAGVPTSIWALAAEGTQDEMMYEVLNEKAKNLSAVLDGGYAQEDNAVFEAVIKWLMEEK